MLMHEKIERSRANARLTLDAYQAVPGADPDPLAAVGDLIIDLLHLSDVLSPDNPPMLLDNANYHYEHERDPANANEHV